MIDLTPFCFIDNDEDLSIPELNQPFHRGLYTLPPIKTSWCGCRGAAAVMTTPALRLSILRSR